MTTLHKILSACDSTQYATSAGQKMHSRLQRVFIDGDNSSGDPEIVNKIKSVPGLASFFSAKSRTELPIAGTINGRFISRRIDRVTIDNSAKRISILDYKTDRDCNAYHSKYVFQIHEYARLLQTIYPGYKIDCYILWTHDFLLENIPLKSL